jgi:beta-lactamase superfamily II metal-dependent hydrolase
MMGRTPKQTAGNVGQKAAKARRDVVVRMYNVGFGDAFLVVIPNGQSVHRVLFDCGSIEAAPDQTMSDVVDQIISDTMDADGKSRIDVVVCTHRHKDHVSGFANPKWREVKVAEVWMPWTEDPSDPAARKIRNTQGRVATALQARLTARAAAGPDPEGERYRDIVANALALSNEAAMSMLHSGFSGDPIRRYLPEKKADESGKERSFSSPALPGVRIHVLGPSRDPEVIRDMDPPKGESYLRLQSQFPAKDGEKFPTPFSDEFKVDDQYHEFFQESDKGHIEAASKLDDLAVAVTLDKAVNGTSLMIVLEISGAHLLFPGDAQWGTWQAALADEQWRELLSKTDFYKVGHHASHNATPKEFVEKVLQNDAWAMASTKVKRIWPDIPKAGLVTALKAKGTKFARSDEGDKATEFIRHDLEVVEMRIPL